MSVYFSSDCHFGHDKEFIYKPRGFSNIYEHDQTIINNWNQTIEQNDEVYLMGDILLGNNDYGIQCLQSLNGKLHIIRGNHDSEARLKLYNQCPNVIEVTEAKFLSLKKYNLFLSHYPSFCGNHDSEKSLKKQTINLCGHSHTKDRFADFNMGLIYHVELDAHNCFPVAFEDVIKDIQEGINMNKIYSPVKLSEEDCPKCGRRHKLKVVTLESEDKTFTYEANYCENTESLYLSKSQIDEFFQKLYGMK
jgi:calcineurin-like phosphoesterase family protein